MVALLLCMDRECRAAFEVEGSRDAISGLVCADCHGPLRAVAWAGAEGPERDSGNLDVRRAA